VLLEVYPHVGRRRIRHREELFRPSALYIAEHLKKTRKKPINKSVYPEEKWELATLLSPFKEVTLAGPIKRERERERERERARERERE
jgi:hypothetical protein